MRIGDHLQNVSINYMGRESEIQERSNRPSGGLTGVEFTDPNGLL